MIFGGMTDRPLELDCVSSRTVIYLRTNIVRHKEQEVSGWLYDEEIFKNTPENIRSVTQIYAQRSASETAELMNLLGGVVQKEYDNAMGEIENV